MSKESTATAADECEFNEFWGKRCINPSTAHAEHRHRPNTSVEATARPWRLNGDRSGWYGIEGPNGEDLATMNASDGDEPKIYPDKANAELIVKAVNNFDALVAALRKAQTTLYSMPAMERSDDLFLNRRREANEQIAAALKLAEES